MPHRILLVDDQEDLLRLLTNALTRAGFEVTATTDGREALSEVHSLAYDLLVTDVVMPDVSGYELLREAAQDIPVIAMTGNLTAIGGADLFRASTIGLGGVEALRKPFEPADLIEKIESVLEDPSRRLPRRHPLDEEHLTP